MIVSPIPVNGRLPLLRHTLERLINKNKVTPICVGDEPEAKELCESLGVEWINHANYPLGAKWNAGFVAARKHNPNGILFVGSSDWVSDDYAIHCEKLLEQYDFIGKLGCYFADVAKKIRAVYWKGYESDRIGEPIGIGRVLSNRLLNKIEWKPFNDLFDNSLDYSMYKKAKNESTYILTDPNQKLVSISTDKWVNKHKFEDHWTGKTPSRTVGNVDILIESFPELNLL